MANTTLINNNVFNLVAWETRCEIDIYVMKFTWQIGQLDLQVYYTAKFCDVKITWQNVVT